MTRTDHYPALPAAAVVMDERKVPGDRGRRGRQQIAAEKAAAAAAVAILRLFYNEIPANGNG